MLRIYIWDNNVISDSHHEALTQYFKSYISGLLTPINMDGSSQIILQEGVLYLLYELLFNDTR